jgi:two-component system, cell cycle sensor histidine kinase and response regulator CckA
VRRATVAILEAKGFATLEAADGVEALEVHRRHGSVALVVLDLTMPRMDGRETYLAMRNSDPGIRVVLTSGFGEAQAIRGFPYHGLAGFLQKPYSATGLLEVLGRVLGDPSASGRVPRG